MKIKFHGEDIASSREFSVSSHSPRGEAKASWHIPEEVPVAFVFNRRNYSVMMATPDDLADFAIGFSLTENIIRDLSDIMSIDIHQSELGVDLHFKVSREVIEKLDLTQRRRNLIGSASCGLCGLENADVLFKKLPQVSLEPADIDETIITKALSNLSDHQPLNHKTRTVHAAAWADLSGDIKIVREDVGRHNALDKLLGALALEKISMESGFVVMSSRCSYEIIEKAALRGVKILVSVSAPTAFALRKAKEANIAVFARFGKGAVRLL